MRWYSSPDLFQKDWFSELSSKHKVLWHYINTHCNVAGIWEPNFKVATAVLNETFSDKDLKAFGPRIQRLKSGRILLIGFATEQWGDLSSKQGIHKKILDLFKTEGLEINDLTLVSPPCYSPTHEYTREGEGERVRVQVGESEGKEFKELWNRLVSYAQIRSMTPARMESLKVRLADPDFKANYPQAIERVGGSRFCSGENEKKWMASVDWFLKPASFTKIMEGKYDDRNGHGRKKIDPITGQAYEPRRDIAEEPFDGNMQEAGDEVLQNGG